VISKRVSVNSEHVLHLVALFCGVAAVAGFGILTLTGHVALGSAAAAGLILGAVNTLAADRLFTTGVVFAATSLFRIVVLTALFLTTMLVFGRTVAIALALGAAASQFILVAVTTREALRK
jgi:hypothetical protein